MPHSPLHTLTNLARDAADAAARALGHINRQRDTASQQLEMLRDYRQDYLHKLQSALQSGLPATDCHNYQRFIATLDEAIAQQVQVVHDAERQLAAGRDHWQQAQRRRNAFETLQSRARQVREKLAARREQRASDEIAARRYFDRSLAA